MKKISIFSVLLFLTITFSISTCKTDLEVNAPYKETTVVYGLLNQNEVLHFIKINKTFLGPRDAYEMAKERDSSEYQNISAVVEEWKEEAKTGREWLLLDSVFTNKESGAFYNPIQKVYYFSEPFLDSKAQYRLNISLDGGAKKVSAKTELIDSMPEFTGGQQFSIPCGTGAWDPCVGFATGRGKYVDKTFTWRSLKDGKRYQLEMTVYYKDILANGSGTVEKTMKWTFQPPIVSNNLNGGEEMSVTIKGEDFYSEMDRQLFPLTDASILRRFFEKFDFTVYIAADDLNTYLLANEPSTGIIQEKPEFTNIENGIGIFSSRLATTSPPKLLDVNSLDELVGGKHTFALKFCRYNSTNGELICN